MRKFQDKYLILRNFNFNSDIKFTTNVLKGSIVHTYETLDMIDQNLVSRGSQKLSSLVELANLSSKIGRAHV